MSKEKSAALERARRAAPRVAAEFQRITGTPCAVIGRAGEAANLGADRAYVFVGYGPTYRVKHRSFGSSLTIRLARKGYKAHWTLHGSDVEASRDLVALLGFVLSLDDEETS